MPHQEPAVGQIVQDVGRLAKQVGDGGLNHIEVFVVFGTVCQLMDVELFQMVFPLESVLSGPAFPDLLQQEIPLGLVPVTSRRICAVVAERVTRCGPALKVPPARLAVRAADCVSVLFHQHGDRGVSIHGTEHLHTGLVEPYQRQRIIERGEPVFVVSLLVGDEIGNAPGKEMQRRFSQGQRFLGGNDGFHSAGWRCWVCSLQERSAVLQGWNAYSCDGAGGLSVTTNMPRMMGWIRQ